MHHHAFQASKRNVNALSSESLSITSILQVAAGRAWTRRVHAKSSLATARTLELAQEPNYDRPEGQSSGAGPSNRPAVIRPRYHLCSHPNKPVPTVKIPSVTQSKPASSVWVYKFKPALKGKAPRCYVDPKKLSDYDLNFIDPASAYITPGEPAVDPTEAVVYSPNYSFLDEYPEPSPSDILTPPETQMQLVRKLAALSQGISKSPQRLLYLRQYHNHYCDLASQKSYQILMDVAINEASFGVVPRLLNDMRVSGIHIKGWTTRTWALWVRWMVRSGRWSQAWRKAQLAFPLSPLGDNGGLPLELWLEFWASAKTGSVRQLVGDEYGKKTLQVSATPYELVNDMGRYHLLMNHAPILDQRQIMIVPPRAVYAIVRARLWGRKREWAMEITRDYFKSVASHPEPSELRMCLKLIHLHLGIGWRKLGFPTLRDMEAIVDELLALNQNVKLDARALVLLLRALIGTRLSAINACQLVRKYKARFGEEIEDRDVRLRVASLAVKERNRKVLGRCIGQRGKGGKVKRGSLDFWRWRRLMRIHKRLSNSNG